MLADDASRRSGSMSDGVRSKNGGIRTVCLQGGRSAQQHPDRFGLAVAPDQQQRAVARWSDGVQSVERSVMSRSAVDVSPRRHIAERTGSRPRPPVKGTLLVWTGPIRVASIPANHPYVRHLAAPGGEAQVVRLPDPAPDVPDPLPGQWWPPVMLDPDWITGHRNEFDLVHLHFGFDAVKPVELQRWIDELDRN